MSRPLVKETEERELRRLQSSLINISKKSEAKSVSISKKDVRNLVELIGEILEDKPIIIDEYLTPNDASEVAGISRPVIIEMLKNGGLIGHMVGKHWRVNKDSLLEYIDSRDQMFQMAKSIDEDGFGIDK